MMNRISLRKVPLAIAIVGVLMIAAVFSLIAYNHVESSLAGKAAASAVSIMKSVVANAPQYGASAESVVAAPQKNEAPLALSVTSDYVRIDETRYIGILSIPSLGLELPVQERYSKGGLKKSPCRYAGSVKDSDLVIAGHNYKAHFGSFEYLSSGDEITFTTVSGKLIVYTVGCVEVLNPWQVEDMVSGEWDLTLFTCTTSGSGSTRLVVRCCMQGAV